VTPTQRASWPTTVVAIYVTAVLFVKSFVEGAGKKMGELGGE
jgi:hypothetical protein